MLVYLPWVFHVEGQEGGYVYLAEYQSGFLDAGRYMQNVFSHIRAQYYLNGWSSVFAPLVGLTAVAAYSRRLDLRTTIFGVLLFLGGLGLGESAIVVLLALVGLLFVSRNSPAYTRSVFITFFLVFAVISPIYSPYTRLLLPLMCAAYILAGVGLAHLAGGGSLHLERRFSHRQMLSMGVLSLLLGSLIVMKGNSVRGHTYAERTGFVAAVEELVPHLPEHVNIAVVGEPAVVFYLRTRGYHAVHLDKLADLYDYFETGVPVYLMCGHYACWNKRDWFSEYPEAFTPVRVVPVHRISEVRLFDDMPPWSAVRRNDGDGGGYNLEVFRLTVPPRKD
jgi:hypothetical protein